jgi:hypothetical protein
LVENRLEKGFVLKVSFSIVSRVNNHANGYFFSILVDVIPKIIDKLFSSIEFFYFCGYIISKMVSDVFCAL